MRIICIATLFIVVYFYNPISCQQAVDPAYLRQYYAQLQQQQQRGVQESTPIHESQADAAPAAQQYHQPQAQRQYQVQRPVQQPQPVARQYQQDQYQPQAYSAPKKAAAKLRVQQQQSEEEEEEYESNPSYQFGFDVKDDEFTNYQNRKEQRDDSGIIQGSYQVVDSDGFIRTVKYTAHPKEGFKAEVIRTPTDIVIKMPEDVKAQQEQEFRRAPVQQQNYQNHRPAQQQEQQGGAARYRLPQIPDNVRQAYRQE